MTMTRRDFEFLAQAIKDMQQLTDSNGYMSRYDVAQVIAGRLETTNPRFNRSRFMTACNVADGDNTEIPESDIRYR